MLVQCIVTVVEDEDCSDYKVVEGGRTICQGADTKLLTLTCSVIVHLSLSLLSPLVSMFSPLRDEPLRSLFTEP